MCVCVCVRGVLLYLLKRARCYRDVDGWIYEIFMPSQTGKWGWPTYKWQHSYLRSFVLHCIRSRNRYDGWSSWSVVCGRTQTGRGRTITGNAPGHHCHKPAGLSGFSRRSDVDGVSTRAKRRAWDSVEWHDGGVSKEERIENTFGHWWVYEGPLTPAQGCRFTEWVSLVVL